MLTFLTLFLSFQAVTPTVEQLERELEAHIRLLADWASLTRYGSENSEVKLDPKVNRVVFLGDEITENWTNFFPGKPYFNRGIAGQTSGQMLLRFRQDVIGLKPKVVVIQTGSNDFGGNAGPATQGTIAENIMSMVELARVHGIRVVLASLTPVCDCAGRKLTDRRTPGKLIGMNGWLRDYAKEAGAVYVNYYGALVEGRAFKREWTVDGLVPNEAGYARMAPLVETAIAEAMR